MLPDKKELMAEEAMIIDTLLAPYGVELTTTQIVSKSDNLLEADGLVAILERLEMNGFLKGRMVVLEGYLVARRVYCFNHRQVFMESKARLQTRVFLDRMTGCKTRNV